MDKFKKEINEMCPKILEISKLLQRLQNNEEKTEKNKLIFDLKKHGTRLNEQFSKLAKNYDKQMFIDWSIGFSLLDLLNRLKNLNSESSSDEFKEIRNHFGQVNDELQKYGIKKK